MTPAAIAQAACVVGLLTTPRVNRYNAPSARELAYYAAELAIAFACLLVPVVVAGVLMSGCAAPGNYSGYTRCDMSCASGCYTDQCLATCGCEVEMDAPVF